MKDTDAAWLAGYVDGDGCITLSGATSQPILHIDSCDKELLDRVVSLCGGFIIKKTKYKEHHRQAYTWRLRGALKIVEVLKVIRPYMTCDFKVFRADILIDELPKVVRKGGHCSKEELAARDAVRKKFRDAGIGRGSQLSAN